jgi:hypothetical protein
MATSETQLSITRLIVIPAALSWLITIFRLVGELQHWSEFWFNPAPVGGGAPIGITWLVPILGVYFAMRGNWGTHYDAVPSGFPEMSLLPRWIWLGFMPQLIFWVAFTIVAGSLFGSIAAAIVYRRKSLSPAAQ